MSRFGTSEVSQLFRARVGNRAEICKITGDMLDAALFERAIAWAATEPRGAQLAEARNAFERRTGVITSGAPDYEARIAHFFEQALCTPFAAGQAAPIAIFAAENAPTSTERIELAGWLRSYRSLFRFERAEGAFGWLRDRIGGARFQFSIAGADRELRAGDCFDGRLVAIGSELWLSPGRVFHPHEADSALDQLLNEATQQKALDAGLLDPLLRMRSRFVEFESIRAEHVYRFDALHAENLGAPWARAARHPTSR